MASMACCCYKEEEEQNVDDANLVKDLVVNKSNCPAKDSVAVKPAAKTDLVEQDPSKRLSSRNDPPIDFSAGPRAWTRNGQPTGVLAPQAPEGCDQEFTIQITRKENVSIGLDVDLIDGLSAVIVAIHDGAVKAFNDSMKNNQEKMLRVNDRIVEVNQVRGNSVGMVTELKTKTTWALRVQRPQEMRMKLDRSAAQAGMDLRYAPNGNNVMIVQVGKGPMQEWNNKFPNKVVRKFDRIIEINGKRGVPTDLLGASSGTDTLDLVVLRYPAL